jgi:hypothetical protein
MPTGAVSSHLLVPTGGLRARHDRDVFGLTDPLA